MLISLFLNYYLLNFYINEKSIFLFNCLINNRFKLYVFFFLKKKLFRQRFVWTSKKRKFIKIIYFKFKKKKFINKIIKLKKFSGLFKRKLNFRITLLRRRSLLFNKILKPRFKYNKKFKKFKFKKFFNYRVNNLDLTRHKKSIFFENRKIIRIFLKNKSLKKQNKLNSYLINLLKNKNKDLFNIFEYKLNLILIKCHFFNSLNDSNFFIKNKYIFINNKSVINTNLIIKTNDIIKMASRYNYYFFYRNNLNNSIFSLKKLNWSFYKFKKKNRFTKIFPKVYHWIYSNIYFGFDVPYFVEVDFVNMTIIILQKPFNSFLFNFVSLKYINLYLTRLYNWNYIN